MTNRRRFLQLALAAPFAATPLSWAYAASPEVFSRYGFAINGHDPVAYFTKDAPTDGSDAHRLKWMGTMWRFSSSKNMAAFEADPHKYAPRYGGYCAYAMAQGAVATTVPEAWTIHDGRLYLNYSTGVRGIWRQDVVGHVTSANGHWPAALNS
ncbi:MAG: YHS domain protein [Marinosulfonomonas sp.]|nr:YHS domain protein [Marinosulfonomonas sp.]